MNIEFVKSLFENVKIFSSNKYADNRGFFLEGYNKKNLKEFGINEDFVQENFFYSKKGVIRGLHFPNKVKSSKLLRVISGRIFEVVVDVRKGSSTFGKWIGIELNSENMDTIFIPSGFAHGYLALENNTVVSLMISDYWEANSETGIMWNDKYLSISWPVYDDDIILADKDKKYDKFENIFDLR